MFKVGTQVALIVAIAGLFSTVTPVMVSAADTTMISNSARASSQTGGQDGQSGADSADGQAGQDGQSGQSSAGVSISNTINGVDSASVIEVSTNGQAEVWYESSTTPTTSQALPSVDTAAVTTSDQTVPSTLSRLQEVVASLKAIISMYVQLIF